MPRVATGEAVLRDAVGDACGRSDAEFRERTGLTAFGDKLSALLMGDAAPSSSAVSCPLPSLAWPLLNWLSIDPTRSAPGRSLGFGANDVRLLAVLAGGAVILLATPSPPAKDCLDVRAPGRGGGPMEVRFPPTFGLVGLDNVTEGARVLEGVPVRGVEAFDGVAESCFVGDFVGDYYKLESDEKLHTVKLTRSMLDGRDPLPAGLGLAAFMLIRLLTPVSGTMLVLRPSPELTTLVGLATFFAGATAFGAAAGCSMIAATAAARRNIPLPISQSKYLSPLTLPSFLPLRPSSSTPIQSPAANPVWPT